MRYLSEEWIVAADNATKNAAATAPLDGVVIDQVVLSGLSYRVTIRRDGASVTALTSAMDARDATARFTQTLATAAAVAQGATDAHQAFLLGQIRFEGDVNLLIERRDAFAWLEAALAPVLAKTTYP